MKRLIASVIAGCVLGITGTAVAGQHYYWTERGAGYKCEGITTSVICKAGNYEVGVTPDFVFVQHRVTEQTFGCRKRSSFYSCVQE